MVKSRLSFLFVPESKPLEDLKVSQSYTMKNITRFRKAEYDEALTLANNGDADGALERLWELRLKVDLSIYRRALVNVTIASLPKRADRDKYAQECINLLDILRQ